MTPLEISLLSAFCGTLFGMLWNQYANRWAFEEQKKALKRVAKANGEPEYEAYPTPDMKHPLTVFLGTDEKNAKVYANIGKFPHMLVGGLTDGGKSNFVNGLLVQLLKKPATQVKLCLIDMKDGMEFSWYEGARHLAHEVAETGETADALLDWLEEERTRRKNIIKAAKKKKLDDYNAASNPKDRLPHLVLFIDEIADLFDVAPQTLDKVARLGRLARAFGIHMVMATQYPTAEVVPTKVSVHCGGRVAFRLNNNTQSRTILQQGGAEEIKGLGVCLFSHKGITRKLQTPLVKDAEIEAAVDQATTPKLRRVA